MPPIKHFSTSEESEDSTYQAPPKQPDNRRLRHLLRSARGLGRPS